MKFGPISIEVAAGKILGHNIARARRPTGFRKGKPLTAEDIGRLREIGREMVYVAELETGDVDEDTAAKRIATAGWGRISIYPRRLPAVPIFMRTNWAFSA